MRWEDSADSAADSYLQLGPCQTTRALDDWAEQERLNAVRLLFYLKRFHLTKNLKTMEFGGEHHQTLVQEELHTSILCLNWPIKWLKKNLSPLAFSEVGGYNALLAKYSSATPANFSSMDPERYNISSHCYTPRPDAFNLLRDPTTGDLPWPGVVFGIAIVGGWYWCTDQVNILLSQVVCGSGILSPETFRKLCRE